MNRCWKDSPINFGPRLSPRVFAFRIRLPCKKQIIAANRHALRAPTRLASLVQLNFEKKLTGTWRDQADLPTLQASTSSHGLARITFSAQCADWNSMAWSSCGFPRWPSRMTLTTATTTLTRPISLTTETTVTGHELAGCQARQDGMPGNTFVPDWHGVSGQQTGWAAAHRAPNPTAR